MPSQSTQQDEVKSLLFVRPACLLCGCLSCGNVFLPRWAKEAEGSIQASGSASPDRNTYRQNRAEMTLFLPACLPACSSRVASSCLCARKPLPATRELSTGSLVDCGRSTIRRGSSRVPCWCLHSKDGDQATRELLHRVSSYRVGRHSLRCGCEIIILFLRRTATHTSDCILLTCTASSFFSLHEYFLHSLHAVVHPAAFFRRSKLALLASAACCVR